jgi:hypothetical protein
VEGYRIIWHISPPYVARAAEMRGGLIEKGIYYVDGLCAIHILLGRVCDPPLGGGLICQIIRYCIDTIQVVKRNP